MNASSNSHSPLLGFTSLPLILQKYLIAATSASIAETVTMPLDTTKVRMQLDVTPIKPAATVASSTSTFSKPAARRGLVATARHIYLTEGYRKLYLGLTPAVLRQSLVGGIGVGLYPQIKDLIVHVEQGHASGQSFTHSLRSFSPTAAPQTAPLGFGTKCFAGAVSGVIGQLIAAPTCVVKVRLQADARLPQPRYQGTLDAFITIPRSEGWRALFRGIVPSLQRAAVMYGATISTYDHVKHSIVRKWYANDGAAMDYVSTHVAASSVSGLVASIVSTPFDTIKSRIIAQPNLPPKQILGTVGGATMQMPSPQLMYSSTFDCVVKTVRQEGVLAIYKGFIPQYVRLAPWQLTFFVVFEQLSIAVTGHSLR